MRTLYTKVAHLYGLSMRLTGLSRSLEHYVHRLPLNLPPKAKILDVACGTGVLGIAFKKSFPDCNVLATDLEETFLQRVRRDLRRHRIHSDEFTLGLADISSPETVHVTETRERIFLEPERFDVVVIGGALGYSRNVEETIHRLLKLIKPGGYFIDIEMQENLCARMICAMARYKNPGIATVEAVLKHSHCAIENVSFKLMELPAYFVRTGIVARKALY